MLKGASNSDSVVEDQPVQSIRSGHPVSETAYKTTLKTTLGYVCNPQESTTTGLFEVLRWAPTGYKTKTHTLEDVGLFMPKRVAILLQCEAG